MLDWVKNLLCFIGAIAIIASAGYYRGVYVTELEYKSRAESQAIANAKQVAELESESAQRLAGIEQQRRALARRVELLRDDHCPDIGRDFWMLYNESLTGNKPANAPESVPLQAIAPTITSNNLLMQDLQSEYRKCYTWVESRRHAP